MKVYVLHYSYYEESEVHGVYTEETMKKEMARYVEQGRARIEKMIAEQEARFRCRELRLLRPK
jgi:hypothetical protein